MRPRRGLSENAISLTYTKKLIETKYIKQIFLVGVNSVHLSHITNGKMCEGENMRFTTKKNVFHGFPS